jgi:dihydroxy-acid dehydratase
MVRIDLNKGECNLLISDAELKKRHADLEASGGYKVPESQTPWQEIFRKETDQLAQGMVLKGAVKFQRVGKVHPVPRDNH